MPQAELESIGVRRVMRSGTPYHAFEALMEDTQMHGAAELDVWMVCMFGTTVSQSLISCLLYRTLQMKIQTRSVGLRM
jgi:hypothetical protein